jgi:hypothetical protein
MPAIILSNWYKVDYLPVLKGKTYISIALYICSILAIVDEGVLSALSLVLV